jgi:hypothetical protein
MTAVELWIGYKPEMQLTVTLGQLSLNRGRRASAVGARLLPTPELSHICGKRRAFACSWENDGAISGQALITLPHAFSC